MTIKEYRALMKDNISSDEIIVRRLNYLKVFLRNIVKSELDKYSKK